MNVNHPSAQAPTRSNSPTLNRSDKRLHGSWLVTARIGWATITLIALLIFAFSLPAYHAQLLVICITANVVTCQTGQITQSDAVALARIGIPLETYAAYMLIITAASSLVFLTVGIIIFWRKSRDVIGLFSSLLLITFGCFGTTRQLAASLAAEYPDVMVAQVAALGALIQYPAILLFFCIFPDGRLVPRWSWLLLGPGAIIASTFALPPDASFSIGNWPPWLFSVVIVFLYGSGLVFQIYRYWRVSRPQQRQQTKWVLFAFVVFLLVTILDSLIGGLVPVLNQPDSLYHVVDATVSVMFFLLPIPLGIGTAILRYRLWDIDTIINKALLYGLLTATLLLVYLGLVFAGQALVANIFGAGNAVVLVVSTLVVAALFQPVRSRIQQVIDQRFYRSKYDAARIVANFSATLRNELDWDQLRELLLGVVQQTMQPTHLSLWICQVKQQKLREDLPALKENQTSTSHAKEK
jgi:hypothetical protein